MTEAGSQDGPGGDAAAWIPVWRVLVATLVPAALTTGVIVLGVWLIQLRVHALDRAHQAGQGGWGGGVVLLLLGLLVLALAALTAVVSAAVLFPMMLPRGYRIRALFGYLAGCLVAAALYPRGLLPLLAALPLLATVPLTTLGRLRWWWSAALVVLAVALVLSPAAAG